MPATVPRTTANSIDAICRGAGDGFHLALNVIAMLIAFIAMIALANYVVALAAKRICGVGTSGHIAKHFRLGQRAVRLADGRAGAGLLERRANSRRTRRAQRIRRLPRPHQPTRNNSRSIRAVSRLPPTRCAASRIFRASPFRSAASARSRRNAAAKWPKSVSAP